ncbi:MAG: hypothetical protein D6820_02090 [Lentisphaerae bacterium]|nr:MAG: hypothetical protein D6820_02090 [Lentisphaerota bacterium]
MQQIVKVLGPHLNGVTPADVENFTPATMMRINKGIDKINEDLKKLAFLQKRVRDLDEKIAKLERDLGEANSAKQRLQAQIETKDKKIGDLQRKLDELIARTSGPGVPQNAGEVRYDGKVLKVNYDFNYIIITHDPKRDRLGYGVVLTVSRDREYICKARISKIYQNCAVADILDEDKLGEVMEGDHVSWLQ